MTGKPARMGGASGYRFILLQRRLQDLRSLRLEAFAVERAIAEDSDLSLLGRLAASQQLVHGFPAAIRRLSLQRWVIKEQISHSECGRRAVSLPPVRVMPTQSLCTHRDGMLVRVWVSRSPPAHSDAFIKASLLPHFSSLSKARRMKHRRYGAEQLGLNDPTLAKPPAYSFFPQHSETILSSRKAAKRAASLGHAQAEPARSPR